MLRTAGRVTNELGLPRLQLQLVCDETEGIRQLADYHRVKILEETLNFNREEAAVSSDSVYTSGESVEVSGCSELEAL